MFAGAISSPVDRQDLFSQVSVTRKRKTQFGILAAMLLVAICTTTIISCNRTATITDPILGPDDLDSRWFDDVTDRVKVDFRHEIGDVNRWDLTQIDGSGVAVFDFDGDGRLDLYFLTLGGPGLPAKNQLYRNMPDGTFRNVSEGSGLDIPGDSCGVIVGDVNNDGKPDVLVTQTRGCRLFLNLGDGKFQDISATAGIDNPLWGTSANFFDYAENLWLAKQAYNSGFASARDFVACASTFMMW